MKRIIIPAAVIATVLLMAAPAWAWSFDAYANSACDTETGHAVVTATFDNTESERGMNVTATDKLTGQSQTQQVAAGDTATFTFDIGEAPTPGSSVRFDLTWMWGGTASDTTYRWYDAVEDCATPTPTTPPPTSTTPPPTTPPPTTPPPTTPPPTTPPPTTHTKTTPPPTHTAHTGGGAMPPLAAAGGLGLIGAAALFVARKLSTD